MKQPDKIKILGVPIDVVDEEACIKTVDRCIAQNEACSIVAVNPEKMMRACKDNVLLEALKSATLLIPDGIGVVLAARFLRLANMQRVAGSDLMPQLCKHAAQKGYSIYLFGASEEVNSRAGEVLLERYPGLKIAGHRNGFVSDDQMPAVIANIRQSGAQILFLGLGSPKQEIWVNQHFLATKVPICQCVGGTFDVIAGKVRRASVLWQRLGLEWAYRLVRQPSRLLRQTALVIFILEILRTKFRSLCRHEIGGD